MTFVEKKKNLIATFISAADINAAYEIVKNKFLLDSYFGTNNVSLTINARL